MGTKKWVLFSRRTRPDGGKSRGSPGLVGNVKVWTPMWIKEKRRTLPRRGEGGLRIWSHLGKEADKNSLSGRGRLDKKEGTQRDGRSKNQLRIGGTERHIIIRKRRIEYPPKENGRCRAEAGTIKGKKGRVSTCRKEEKLCKFKTYRRGLRRLLKSETDRDGRNWEEKIKPVGANRMISMKKDSPPRHKT